MKTLKSGISKEQIGETLIPHIDSADVPILLLIFNRPDTTRQVLSALRGVKPRKLYIAADGPRKKSPDDIQKIEAARKVAMTIDWDCEVLTLFRDDNLGCRRAVSSGIDWFFDHEEEGIILEDDCIPDQSFFRYAGEMLAQYRNDERVMVVAANHFHGTAHKIPYSYFFSRYNHCWGWASWRRAWKYYDHEMTLWPTLRESDWLLGIGNGSRRFQRYWSTLFDRAFEEKVDSWAYRWTFSCWSQNGLSILPARNLVANIGFGTDATHTGGSTILDNRSVLERLDFPLVHPRCMVRDVKADAWSDRHLFKIDGRLSINRLAKRIFEW